MLSFLIRRLGYGVPPDRGEPHHLHSVLHGQHHDDMARMNVGGGKRVHPSRSKSGRQAGLQQAPVDQMPRLGGLDRVTDTVFWDRSVSLFAFDFGRADNDSAGDIGYQIWQRMGVSLQLTLPLFVMGLVASVIFSLWLVMFRGTQVDFWGVVACVVMMSISALFYIIGQYIFSRWGQSWRLSRAMPMAWMPFASWCCPLA